MRFARIFLALILIFFESILSQNSPIIITPNGSETLIVGSSKLIEWTGVLPSDTVTIEYSINRCSTWILITEKGTGLKYNWTNIPNTISDNCLLRIRRFNKFITGVDEFQMKGHSSNVFRLAWSPDATKAVTVSLDGSVIVWDLIKNTQLYKISNAHSACYSCSWNKVGNLIATGGKDSIKVWNAKNGKLLKSFKAHNGTIASLAWKNNCNILASCADDKSIKIWDIEKTKLITTLIGHSNLVHSVSWSHNGLKLASASWDQTVKIWDMNSYSLLKTLTDFKDVTYHAFWSPNDSMLSVSTGVNDLSIKIYNTTNWSIFRSILLHSDKINTVPWSIDGTKILSASDDGKIIEWDVNSGIILRTFTHNNSPVYYADYSPIGNRILSTAVEPTVIIRGKDTIPYFEDLSDSVWSIVPQSNFQNISGIINIYKPVTAFDYCENSITVSNTDSLKVGDKVLMIQMQGALIETTNTAKFGDITDIRSAGLYEFGFIKQIINNRIIFDKKMINKYNLDGNVQIVTVPIYNNLEITNTLTAQSWNGKTGGILVFEADSILLSANIDVSGKGFRGGKIKQDINAQADFYDYFTPDNNNVSARKGEGVSEINFKYSSSRGKIANGGGGGNSHNAGGGGGANISNGGIGGKAWSGFGKEDLGGLGGISLDKYKDSRFFLGGGGGAGEGNDGTQTDGGNSGGIVIIKANSLINSNEYSILSIGINALEAGNDGAGGGGAGGNISILINNFDYKTKISLFGGKGGDNNNGPPGYTYCIGPGGGGSGGLLNFVSSKPNNFITDVTGGNAGVITNKISSCGYLSNYGATDGGNGLVNYSNTFTFVTQNKPFIPLSNSYLINKGKVNYYLCNTDSLDLAVEPFDKNLEYNWSNGNKGANINVKQTGNYSCTISNGLCNKITTCNVNLIPKMNFKITKQEYSSGCGIDSIKLNVNPNPSDFIYGWNTLETNSSITVSKTGKYKVYIRSKDANFNCIDSLEIDILIDSKAGNTNSLVIDVENKIISLDTVYSHLIDCRNLKIINTSDKSILINDKSFNINKQFTLPSSQFPLIINAKDSINLVYCFFSLNSGIYRDTLILNDECYPHKLRFVSNSIIPDKSGNNKCGNDYELKFNNKLIEKNLNFLSIFPNPANESINIEYEFNNKIDNSEIDLEYSIYNLVGMKLISDEIKIQQNTSNVNQINVSLKNFVPSNYYILLKYKTFEKIFWIIKE
ncbi:MAG: WD40 repeat domain-containing protein [Candidatus Kapabacteria bacterium]|nr:WD40 repeat domain-containing protein [Candidatus Kapabacteria bacterium]